MIINTPKAYRWVKQVCWAQHAPADLGVWWSIFCKVYILMVNNDFIYKTMEEMNPFHTGSELSPKNSFAFFWKKFLIKIHILGHPHRIFRTSRKAENRCVRI